MSLGLKIYHAAGEFSPRLEYNAKSGRLTRVDRTADGSDVIRIDLTMAPPPFAWDVGSIEVGWINFQAGIAPSFALVPYGQPMPARPDRNHKAGFRSRVWEGPGNVTREFSATAGVTVNAIEAFWDVLTAAPQAAAGQIPVIRLVNVVAITTGKGTNYAPDLSILQWIDRDPAVFGPRTVAAPGSAPIVMVAAPPPSPPAAPLPTAWPVVAPPPVAPAAWPLAA
jgi:hypothetical protein